MRIPKFRCRQQGLTLLELAIIIALLGTYIMVLLHYRTNRLDGGDSMATGIQDQIVAAVYRYAERHYRLPCADTNGDGFEGAGPDGCRGAQQHQVGGVPYRTLGLSESDALRTGINTSFFYGVYRKSHNDKSQDTDLAVLEERTNDSNTAPGYRQLDDLRYALSILTSTNVDTDRVHVTGDGDATGPADCATNKIANVAFFVLYAGARDANANGKQLDGANSQLSWPSGGALCVASQTTRASEQYDDSVIAVGFAELLGYLSH